MCAGTAGGERCARARVCARVCVRAKLGLWLSNSLHRFDFISICIYYTFYRVCDIHRSTSRSTDCRIRVLLENEWIRIERKMAYFLLEHSRVCICGLCVCKRVRSPRKRLVWIRKGAETDEWTVERCTRLLRLPGTARTKRGTEDR